MAIRNAVSKYDDYFYFVVCFFSSILLQCSEVRFNNCEDSVVVITLAMKTLHFLVVFHQQQKVKQNRAGQVVSTKA